MTKTVAVIGAGITGLCSAYYLARQGYSVGVYESERYVAMKTSYANGGQISVSNSEVWNTWSNVKKVIRWMFTKNAPLLIRPRWDLAQWRWMIKFLWYTVCGSYSTNTAKTIKLGLQSRELYRHIIADEGIEFDQRDSGILHFYKDPHYWQRAREVKDLYNNNGLEWDLLTAQQVQTKFQGLEDIRGVVGGTWTESDFTGDIHKFCQELAQVLKNRYDVSFFYNHTIKDVEHLGFYDAVVVANGVGSTALAKKVGDSIDVYPVKGYSITINNVDPEHLPQVSLLDDQAKIVTSSLGNRFRVAGTAELAGENYDIRRDRVQPLLDWVHENFPQINTHDYTQWACLRPMTPNMMPVIKQSAKNPRVFYNTGHGHLGWTLGPATGLRVAQLIKEQI